MVVANVVKNEKDKFGTERFAALKAQFKHFKLNKHFQNRLNKIESVFIYRCGVAYELHHIEERAEGSRWDFHHKVGPARERLDTFKPVQFFLDVMQALLVEVKEEEMSCLERACLRKAKSKPEPIRKIDGLWRIQDGPWAGQK